MKRPEDPIDRLRRANPVSKDAVPQPDSPGPGALFERIVATPPTPERFRKKSRWGRAWILVPAVLLALGAATYGLLREVREPLVIACYGAPRLSANVAEVPPASDPVAACRAAWSPGTKLNPSGSPPPPLIACVLDSGAIGVFPDGSGADVCAQLGLAHPEMNGRGLTERQAIIRLQDDLANRFLSACVHHDQALSIIRRDLDRFGLDGWQVKEGTPFTDREPCASVAIDTPARTVHLVPVTDSP